MGRYKKSIMKLVYSNGKLRKFPLAKMWVFRNFSAVALLFYGVPKIQFILFENLKFSFPAFFMIPYPVPTNKAMLSNGGRSPLTLSACIFTVVIAYISRKVSKLNLQSISWYAFSSFEFAVFVCPTYRPLLFAACAAIKKPPSILSTSSRLRQRFFVASRLPVRKIFRILQRLNWGCGHSARLQKFQALPPCSRFGSCSSVPIGLLHL